MTEIEILTENHRSLLTDLGGLSTFRELITVSNVAIANCSRKRSLALEPARKSNAEMIREFFVDGLKLL